MALIIICISMLKIESRLLKIIIFLEKEELNNSIRDKMEMKWVVLTNILKIMNQVIKLRCLDQMDLISLDITMVVIIPTYINKQI
jgi:hypothetical protein